MQLALATISFEAPNHNPTTLKNDDFYIPRMFCVLRLLRVISFTVDCDSFDFSIHFYLLQYISITVSSQKPKAAANHIGGAFALTTHLPQASDIPLKPKELKRV
jgi:hypothetical protein